MTGERTGPPIKRKAATQGSEPEQPRDFGSNTDTKYTTPKQPRQLSRAEWLRIHAINGYDDLKAWADDADIPIVVLPVRDQTLASAAAWIAIDAGRARSEEVSLALSQATHLITVSWLNPYYREAAKLAVRGHRIVMLRWPVGCAVPLPRGGHDA